MKVFIKNKFFSIGGASSVKNERGEDVYFVKGRAFSPTRVKHVCDKSGKKLYKVRNKFMNFLSHRAYIYDATTKTKIARVKHPFFGMKKFVVEGYKDEILIDGEFFSLRSTIVRNGKPIGVIDRELTIFKDAFCLDADEADIPFLIALVIAIDVITDSK